MLSTEFNDLLEQYILLIAGEQIGKCDPTSPWSPKASIERTLSEEAARAFDLDAQVAAGRVAAIAKYVGDFVTLHAAAIDARNSIAVSQLSEQLRSLTSFLKHSILKDGETLRPEKSSRQLRGPHNRSRE